MGAITSRGGRNLLILCFFALAITVTTTTISLMIYRNSGDIYLDRSRPGFLPDEDEATTSAVSNPNYAFSDNGPLNKEELRTYLEELDKIYRHIEALEDPYSEDPLSNLSLGLTPNDIMPESPQQ